MVEFPREDPVVLFDGVCNLCSGSVQFLIEHDPEARLRFAPLQSEPARELLEAVGLHDYDCDSIVLVEGEAYYTKSEAALRIARRLERPWSLLWTLRYVPRVLRDAVYDLVAASRYAVFGKRDQCMVPTPAVRDRFLAVSSGSETAAASGAGTSEVDADGDRLDGIESG
ncbi:MAG: thiol-disulfide oxidoreductase DCC family protein [Haloarculaceae archaeon]